MKYVRVGLWETPQTLSRWMILPNGRLDLTLKYKALY